MKLARLASHALDGVRIGLSGAALLQLAVGAAIANAAATPAVEEHTHSPIKHVIVIVGENRSFDHVFATYVPKKGESVWNLLSEGIVKADGTPGLNFAKAAQLAATDGSSDGYLLDPTTTTFSGSVLPAPLVGGPTDSYVQNDSLT